MLRGFATVNYFAADLTAAAAWYTEVLGVPPYYDQVPGYIEFRVGDYADELGLVDAAYGPPAETRAAWGGLVPPRRPDDLASDAAAVASRPARSSSPAT